MEITVLGTASIGGVPEWDCTCPNCSKARANLNLRRTRSSIAISCGDDKYILVDAGHDLKQQLEAARLTPILEKTDKTFRQSRIDSILLTHGHADHTVGLAEFCTGRSFEIPVYAPPDLLDFLFGSETRPAYFSELGRLAKNYVVPYPLSADDEITLLGEIRVRGFEVPHTKVLDNGRRYPSSTYAYEFEHKGSRFVYAPDLGAFTEELLSRIDGVELFITDACFWWNDELLRVSGIPVTSYDLGHVPMEESVKALSKVGARRVVYTHFNHTNPVIDASERYMGRVLDAGQELAYDGLKIRI